MPHTRPPRLPLWKRLTSYLVSWVVETRPSQLNPDLEVVYCSGRYQLHAGEVNYSFGELHTAFADTFKELEVLRRQPARVLVLGLGAGSIPYLLKSQHPAPVVTGVELDPAVVELGKRYFGLDGYPHLHIDIADAAAYILQTDKQWDLICLDVFVEDQVPRSLDHMAVMEALRRALAPGGLLIWNRLVHNAATADRTRQFQQLFTLVFPQFTVHRVLSNYMFIAEASAS
ncbi:MAG: fused MFS/spermidine synthase [Bacteroidetes bacterium]|nr:fused MFS/spermidine synthase [Bacteroidota bacterium]